MLEDLVPDFDERGLLHYAPTGRGRFRSNALYDLARLLHDVVAVEIVEVPACRARLLREQVGRLIQRRQPVAEEHSSASLRGALSAAEDRPRQRPQPLLQAGIGLQESLVRKMEVLHRGARPLVDVVELLQCRVVVLGGQKLLALDAERLRDQERLAGHGLVQREDLVELSRGEEVPEADFPPGVLEFRVIRTESFLGLRIHPAVDTADALHEPNGVPADVVVDEAGGVLEVQAFREDVRRDEDPDLLLARG